MSSVSFTTTVLAIGPCWQRPAPDQRASDLLWGLQRRNLARRRIRRGGAGHKVDAFRRAGVRPLFPLRRIRGASGRARALLAAVETTRWPRPHRQQNGAMARGRRRRPRVRPSADDGGPRRLGPHWRADGAPKAAHLTQGEALSG